MPAGHSSLNAVPVMLTASLKFTVTLAFGSTPVAPLAGVVLVTTGGVSTENVATKFAPIGVPALTSVTCEATTVTVQVTPPGRFAPGWSTKLDAGEAGVTVKAMGVPAGHSSLNAVPVTLTASSKFTVTVLLSATLVAAFAGVVLVTSGAVSAVKVAT